VLISIKYLDIHMSCLCDLWVLSFKGVIASSRIYVSGKVAMGGGRLQLTDFLMINFAINKIGCKVL
jgi:hypothetical protein